MRAWSRKWHSHRAPALHDRPGTRPGSEPSGPPRRRGSSLQASPRTARTDGSPLLPRLPSRDPPENPDNAAEQARVAGANRLHALVLRLEPDLVLFTEEALDGRLVVSDQGDHDLTVAGALRGAHPDEVTFEDAGLLHALAADAQDVVPVLAADHVRDLDVLPDVLLGQHRLARRDLPDQRQP